MPTFGQLKTIVSRKLLDSNNQAVSASDVGDAINYAINYWQFQRFWFNEASTQVQLSAGVNNITSLLPSDFLFEFPENGFVIQYSNLNYPLFHKSPQIFDWESIENSVGMPYIYTFRNQNYEIYFFPQVAYLMNIYYVKSFAELTQDSDTNAFTQYADQLIIYEALSRLTSEDRQDLQMGNTYAAKADREATNLKQRTFKQTGSGEFTVDTIIS